MGGYTKHRRIRVNAARDNIRRITFCVRDTGWGGSERMNEGTCQRDSVTKHEKQM